MSTLAKLAEVLDYIERHSRMAIRHANDRGRLQSLENVADAAVRGLALLGQFPPSPCDIRELLDASNAAMAAFQRMTSDVEEALEEPQAEARAAIARAQAAIARATGGAA